MHRILERSRCTDKLNNTFELAKGWAFATGQPFVETEHLLGALIEGPRSSARIILEKMSIYDKDVMMHIAKSITRGPDSEMEIMCSPHVERVFISIVKMASDLGNNWYGTEHLLLALISVDQGLAFKVLNELGADLKRARELAVAIQDGVFARTFCEAVPSGS